MRKRALRYACLALTLCSLCLVLGVSRAVVDNDSETIPVYISSDNHVFAQVRINNSAPLWFVVDSGAGDLLINKRVAEAVGLKFESRSQAFGAGKDPVDVLITEEASVQVGQLCSFRKQMSAFAMDTFEAYFGREVAGIIGYDLFSRFVIEIDYLRSTLTLHKPQTYRYNGPGQTLPISFNGRAPRIPVAMKLPNGNPVSGQFLIDTGAHLAVVLNRPFYERHRFLESVARTVPDPWSPGLGGDAELLLTRAQYFKLGQTTLAEPVIAFALAREGSLAGTAFDGVVGGELLRRFKVIFDFARSRLILEPNEHLRQPYVYSTEMLGIGIIAAGKDFRSFLAHRIVAGSPAAKAGLKAGDVIAEIDGQTTATLSMDQLRQIFKQDKPQYVITIKRGRQILPIRIKSEKIL